RSLAPRRSAETMSAEPTGRNRPSEPLSAPPISLASLLPIPPILSKYRPFPRRCTRVADHGRSEKESLAIAAQHAPLPRRAARLAPLPGGAARLLLCRMPDWRRADAPASFVPRLRTLRRARGAAAPLAVGLSSRRRRRIGAA